MFCVDCWLDSGGDGDGIGGASGSTVYDSGSVSTSVYIQMWTAKTCARSHFLKFNETKKGGERRKKKRKKKPTDIL